MEKLTSDILKARERIHVILNKLSVGDVTNNSKYAILYTSKLFIYLIFIGIKSFFLDDFTEDVYFMHEELVQELEAQYEVNKNMYEQIEIWNELFAEFQEFEVLLSFFSKREKVDPGISESAFFSLFFSLFKQKIFFSQKNASDPQRFHRRGYSALSEDKTRKKLESTLRECELRLENLANEFMKKNNGKKFLMSSNGKEISDYIAQRKEDYVKNKEREREAAKVKQEKGSYLKIDSFQAGRTPLKIKQLVGTTPNVVSKSGQNPNLRTPLATSRRVGIIPHLPTGKTPLNNSTIKTRAQQTTKRINIDPTSSTLLTPIKQRRLIDQIENISIGNTTTGLKSSMIAQTTPSGKRPLIKRAIPTPNRIHK